MAVAKSPAWLPAGWMAHDKVQKNGRKVRYYTNSEIGQKFFSMKALKRYVKMGKNHYYRTRASKKRMHGSNKIPDWLPKGWIVEVKTRKSGSKFGQEYKCYTDPVSGFKFYSYPEVSRYLQTVKHSSSTPNQVMVEKVEAVGLPPGWIKEIKIRKGSRHGIRKDPYYTDPVSGCIFRSKIDALRYVETGEMSKRVITPKKRLIDDQESIKDVINPPSAAKRQKLTHFVTRKPLFPECSAAGALPESEGSKEKESAEIMSFSNHSTENVHEVHSLNNMTKSCAEMKTNSDMSNSALPKARVSNRRGKKDIAENGFVSTTAAVALKEKIMLENQDDSCSKKATNNRNKDKKVLNTPCRFSKRLAGLSPVLLANLDLGERAVRMGARSSKNEATAAQNMDDKASQQAEAEREAELLIENSDTKEAFAEEASDKNREPQDDRAAPEEQLEKVEMENKENPETESQPLFPFLDSWSDPCLEFAFKTLTGAIPLEDDLAIQGYFQQQYDTSCTQSNGGLVLPDFGEPSFCQSDIASLSGPGEKQTAKKQLPVQHTVLPSGDVSLPSCSSVAPHQPSLNASKEYHINVDY